MEFQCVVVGHVARCKSSRFQWDVEEVPVGGREVQGVDLLHLLLFPETQDPMAHKDLQDQLEQSAQLVLWDQPGLQVKLGRLVHQDHLVHLDPTLSPQVLHHPHAFIIA